MARTITIPAVGDRHEFHTLTGYVLEQHRPFRHTDGSCPSCIDRPWASRCADPALSGTTTVDVVPVARVIHWADNSVEVVGVTDDGRTVRDTLVAPHGDVC